MSDDVPLICDPVPGPEPAFAVLLCDRRLSEREIAAFRAEWAAAISSGQVMFFTEDVRPVAVWEPRQWPDAEFCAA